MIKFKTQVDSAMSVLGHLQNIDNLMSDLTRKGMGLPEEERLIGKEIRYKIRDLAKKTAGLASLYLERISKEGVEENV